MENQPTIKGVFSKDIRVGTIVSIGDHLADAKASYELLKSRGLIKELSQAAVMFRQAVAFCTVASDLYAECSHSPERLGTVGIPLVVNMAFSIELYLKTLGQVHGKVLLGHDLVKIFEKLILPLKNVSLAEWFNSDKENANDENIKGALHARIQARGSQAGRGRANHCRSGQNAGGG